MQKQTTPNTFKKVGPNGQFITCDKKLDQLVAACRQGTSRYGKTTVLEARLVDWAKKVRYFDDINCLLQDSHI